MKIGIVYFSNNNNNSKKLENIANIIAESLKSRNHLIDVYNGSSKDDIKLTPYKYVIIGSEISLFRGKLPKSLERFMTSAGFLEGKMGFAFVLKNLFMPGKGLKRLMTIMEKEGIMLNASEVISGLAQAKEIASTINID